LELPEKYALDVAEDVFQDTMVRAVERYPRSSNPAVEIDAIWFYGQLKTLLYREIERMQLAQALDSEREDVTVTSVLHGDSSGVDPAELVLNAPDAQELALEAHRRREFDMRSKRATKLARELLLKQEPWVRKAIVRKYIGKHDQHRIARDLSAKFGRKITHVAVRAAMYRFEKRLRVYLGELANQLQVRFPGKRGGRPPAFASDDRLEE
jgi:hypothetical protein